MRRLVRSLAAQSAIAAVLVSLVAAGCQDGIESSSAHAAHAARVSNKAQSAHTTQSAYAAPPRAAQPCAASVLALRPGPPVGAMTGEHADSFMLTNRGPLACTISGYPQVTLYDSRGVAMPFRYATGGGVYVTASKPAIVTLAAGKSAYVLVAKYRCDLGVADDSTAIQLTLRAHQGPAFSGREPIGAGLSGLAYCKGGREDPGQLVTVSPIEATFQATSMG